MLTLCLFLSSALLGMLGLVTGTAGTLWTAGGRGLTPSQVWVTLISLVLLGGSIACLLAVAYLLLSGMGG
jgi:hypothetical protein